MASSFYEENFTGDFRKITIYNPRHSASDIQKLIRMTTTTGDPSTLKTPASLSSGDLVSRLLAATPPYLYNVPLTPHSFFFSEMLRSFVQAKAEASSSSSSSANISNTSVPRRRKRSWRDARDRPLELTTKERSHHHHHHHQQQEKYFHAQQQQPQHSPQQDARLENRGKQSDGGYELDNKPATFDQKSNNFASELLKPLEESKSDFAKHSKSFFEERPCHYDQSQSPENLFSAELQKVKPEEQQQHQQQQQQQQHVGDRKSSNYGDKNNYEERASTKSALTTQELSLLSDQKKVDFSRNFLPGLPARGCEMLQGVKGFGLPANVSSSEFLPGPLWYPPYPMAQSYPGIDPLHFFIDLRVSGHIWDRKLSERQLPFKSKHCSAFSVPQSKEYSNRPLNLTRDEASTSRSNEENPQGTNYILKHLTRTYRDIHKCKGSRVETSTAENEDVKQVATEGEDSPRMEDAGTSNANKEEERKDLRAVIGLELVVDYVKEPKGDPSSEAAAQVTE